MLAAASLPGRKSAFTAEGGKKIKPVGAQLSTVRKQMKDDFDGADNAITLSMGRRCWHTRGKRVSGITLWSTSFDSRRTSPGYLEGLRF
jgi:hypothetical protein